ncbi:hypothetical protein [Actinomadura rugatobispora]|uniref:Uncharacterized protein n=1 Tax=Actinomadura rugatobispora TaxID=1994 RepID=A0ABW0ZUY4_9ACTN
MIAIDWSRYESAAGPVLAAYEVPGHLIELAHTKPERASHAARRLNESLCHQGVFIDSAALPALPFLLEALRSTTDTSVAWSLLHLLEGFADCSRSIPGPNRDWPNREWVITLRQELVLHRSAIASWTRHEDENVRTEAQAVLSSLDMD